MFDQSVIKFSRCVLPTFQMRKFNTNNMNWSSVVCLFKDFNSGMRNVIRKSRSFITEKIPKVAKEEWNSRLRGKKSFMLYSEVYI